MRERFWEIDALRGIAVIAMILYNFSYDPAYLGFFDNTHSSLPQAVRPLAFLGRHSLLVYLIHQPILRAALILLGVGDAGLL